ncbi:hypothetical protein [Streptomyces acidicola]|uniref:hypothetical protein n=1 Tax=Streptomyces acidicola TaxID=2596892 RepID=UPI003822B6D6
MTERRVPQHTPDGYDRILAQVSATGRRLPQDEIASRRALGEEAAEADLALGTLGPLTTARGGVQSPWLPPDPRHGIQGPHASPPQPPQPPPGRIDISSHH